MRVSSLVLVVLAASCGWEVNANGCSDPVKFSQGSVCRCTQDECDSVLPVGSLSSSEAALYSTSKDSSHATGDRLTKKPNLQFTQTSPGSGVERYSIRRNIQYQTILGFGGALTDAATYNIKNMDSGVQKQILNNYYGENGIQYSLGRIPIGSADFSLHSYSYDDFPNDFNLHNFSVETDEEFKLPVIREALSLSSRPLAFFASLWSAPAWMKTSNSSIGGSLLGNPSNSQDPYYQTFAQYYSRFITEYKNKGVPIWGLTTQNEPYQNNKWDTQAFTPSQLRDWIANHLGPTIRRDHPQVKIIAHDDSRGILVDNMKVVMESSTAREYIDGIGVHWYQAVNDYFPNFDKLNQTHSAYPDTFILATEACEGYLPWDTHCSLGDFTRGLTYAYDIIGDLFNWAVGWTDWNLVLDTQGGPNHSGNYVDAPIIVDPKNSTFFYKQPMYYAMGHFSKFIAPGAKRIDLSPSSTSGLFKFELIAFLSPVDTPAAGKVGTENIVIVGVNIDPFSSHKVAIHDEQRGWLNFVVPPSSIQTVVYPA